ncbi:YhdH/YhfP family quinone oxidoreductase [Vagococcus vulneris]|uniref:Enoyl reductase (ER) domain-containing protein n=1 Tax=Vagococcus vulneris TaxID=1977869 RepID=A0A430A0B6_9ENTE|nr:YhdH/YhfP family quinone oxidoreductase [Vagococcus vulneris]RST99772.1 hypothetical protein CBF37_03340 [Vagococcus vulneris]
MTEFKALLLEDIDGEIGAKITSCHTEQLSEGDTLIAVSYSAINYKDALATQPGGGVVRNYPMIPGIDLVGKIIETTSQNWQAGDEVIVTGQGTGVTHTGGLSGLARIPSDWMIKLPSKMTARDAMIFGTAGITAMRAIQRLENEGMGQDKDVPIMVSGASGGVGSLALIFLASLGYTNIIALSRKNESISYLKSIGAHRVMSPETLHAEKYRPLERQQVAYVIDTIGGSFVENILPKVAYGGAVALCGNASGIKFSGTVLPFILRGIAVLGVDSVQLSQEDKKLLWERIAELTDKPFLEKIKINEVALTDELMMTVSELLQGTHTGRTIVKI